MQVYPKASIYTKTLKQRPSNFLQWHRRTSVSWYNEFSTISLLSTNYIFTEVKRAEQPKFVSVMTFTPPRTPRISTLKSQTMKPTF